MYFILKSTGFLIYWLLFRTKVFFEDKKVQTTKIKGRAIIVSNHRSVWDLAMLIFVFFGRNIKFLVAEIMFTKSPIFSFFLEKIGGIKVDRKGFNFNFIRKSELYLVKNKVVAIFPEGRLPNKGEEMPLKFTPSTVYIALETGAPIIPVFTDGCYFKWHRNNVIVGKPIYVKELYDQSLSERENINNLTVYLRSKVVELENELNRQKNKKKSV